MVCRSTTRSRLRSCFDTLPARFSHIIPFKVDIGDGLRRQVQMIGTQSVKAIKLSSLARTSLRHALSSQSSSASHRANSTTSTQQHLPSGEFFTSAPAPPAVDYSSAFFTSAPVPTSTQAPAASAGRYQTADHTENGRTGKGNSQGKQRHEWTFSVSRA